MKTRLLDRIGSSVSGLLFRAELRPLAKGGEIVVSRRVRPNSNKWRLVVEIRVPDDGGLWAIFTVLNEFLSTGAPVGESVPEEGIKRFDVDSGGVE